MKKMVAAAAVAAGLTLAMASPALAQDAIADDDSFASTETSVFFYDASQFQVAGALQTNTGDATATATDDSVAGASIDQSLYIDQYQFNGGFGGYYFYY